MGKALPPNVLTLDPSDWPARHEMCWLNPQDDDAMPHTTRPPQWPLRRLAPSPHRPFTTATDSLTFALRLKEEQSLDLQTSSTPRWCR